MQIVLDLNARQDVVKQLKTDDKTTGLRAGTFVTSKETYEKVREFLEKIANAN